MVLIVIAAQMLDYNDMNRIQSNTQWHWKHSKHVYVHYNN